MTYSLARMFKVRKPTHYEDDPATGSIRDVAEDRFPFAEWSDGLVKMSGELRQLAGSTEGEFLAIGSQLHDFYQRGGNISQLAGRVVDQVGGHELQDAINGLATLLDQMQDYLNGAARDSANDCQSLTSVLGMLDHVSEPLDGFKKINKVLRMLGTSTKIESARLGQSAAGFDTLAADVANLSVQVVDKSQTILEQQGKLGTTIRATLERVEDFEVEQGAQVRSILLKTRESLASLKEINHRCTALAAVVATSSSEVSRSISEVVTSMQFHDIVRQQIEHVEIALVELHERVAVVTAHSNATDGRDLVVETGDICELQAAQLRQASQEIRNAISSIIENLRAIARKEGDTAEETRVMAGVADQAGSSFFTDMKRDLEQVASSLADSAQANHDISQAMNTVAGTVGEIVSFVGDIENIGEEIELIALNAQIKAARTGKDGAALGVLAEAIQRLSVEAQQQTTTVSETLRDITDTTEKLFKGVNAEAQALEQEVDVMVRDLHELLQTLQGLNESLIANLGFLEREVHGLSADIDLATSSVTVHEQMMGGLENIVGALEGLISQSRELVPVDSVVGRAERLKELASRYTMHSERRVHAGIAQTGLVEHETTSGGGELGDNIELF